MTYTPSQTRRNDKNLRFHKRYKILVGAETIVKTGHKKIKRSLQCKPVRVEGEPAIYQCEQSKGIYAHVSERADKVHVWFCSLIG